MEKNIVLRAHTTNMAVETNSWRVNELKQDNLEDHGTASHQLKLAETVADWYF